MEILLEVKQVNSFDSFLELLQSSKRVVALTGAGISTLSGIPDFRSSNGIYSKKFGTISVEELLDISFFKRHPEEFYSWAKDGWYTIDNYKPNIIHHVLHLMEEKNILTDGIFTQNIDSLDIKEGSKNVYELHGSLRESVCLGCGKRYSYKETKEKIGQEGVPRCDYCHSLLKPNIVFYGESLDNSVIAKAYDTFSSVDLAIVLGSSLVVSPASGLPYETIRGGNKLVIVNRDTTYLDSASSFLFRDLESWGKDMLNYLKNRD